MDSSVPSSVELSDKIVVEKYLRMVYNEQVKQINSKAEELVKQLRKDAKIQRQRLENLFSDQN